MTITNKNPFKKVIFLAIDERKESRGEKTVLSETEPVFK